MRGPVIATLLALVVAACTVSTGAEREPVRSRSLEPSPSAGRGETEARASSPTPAVPSPASPPPPRFRGSIREIGRAEREALVPRNWRPGCPVPLEDLRWLKVSYWGFDGRVRRGPLVVHVRVAEDVLWVFERLFERRFPIEWVELPPRYRPERDRWDDRRNVTAAFNCRPVVERPGTWSQHAYGWAIDINPVQNPYVRADGSVLREVAKPYRDRSRNDPGMIHAGSRVVRLFARIGWSWGGDWATLKDYMHFSLTGR